MGNGVYINGEYVDNFGGGGMYQGPDIGASSVKNYFSKYFF